MKIRPLEFDIYRLNKVDEDGLLPYMGAVIATDADILRILAAAANPDFDVISAKEKASTEYEWAVRSFTEIDNEGIAREPICTLTIARSVVKQTGAIVTDQGIEFGTSTPDQGLAATSNLVFFMERHLVAVEIKSALMGNQAWRASLHQILDRASASLNFSTTIRIEPVARNAEILESFRSFTLLTRLRVRLLIPNPDMTREMQKQTDEMKEGGIREFLQDMKNKKGLNQTPGRLPFSTAAIADRGYKSGPVTMEGVIDGKQTKIITGKNAERVSIEQPAALQDIHTLVKGFGALATTKEGRTMMKTLNEAIEQKLQIPQAP